MSIRFVGLMLAAPALVVAISSCTIDIPNPIATATPFIVKGTSTLRDVFGQGQCLVWVADTGVNYHLFQGDSVSSLQFDAVMVPGVTARLRIAVRDDLEVGCRLGRTVVVEDVLQIIQ